MWLCLSLELQKITRILRTTECSFIVFELLLHDQRKNYVQSTMNSPITKCIRLYMLKSFAHCRHTCIHVQFLLAHTANEDFLTTKLLACALLFSCAFDRFVRNLGDVHLFIRLLTICNISDDACDRLIRCSTAASLSMSVLIRHMLDTPTIKLIHICWRNIYPMTYHSFCCGLVCLLWLLRPLPSLPLPFSSPSSSSLLFLL